MQSWEREAHSTRSAVVTLSILVVVLPAVVIAAYVLPSPVALVAPGPVEPVDSLIKVDGSSYESDGHLYLTAVRVTLEPRLGQYLLARLQPDVQVVAKGEVMPISLSREEFQSLSQRLLEESQNIAQVIALRQTGCKVKLGDASVEVVTIVPGTPAASILQAGDVIETAGGETIATTAELVSIVHSRVTGEPIALRLRRAGRPLTVMVPTIRGPIDSEGPVLGVVTVTRGFDVRAPVSIKIDAGQAGGGPSAGLMYALGVYNALVTEDITRGRKIAGTGTLRLNGTVGPVGAVQLKVRAAEDAGAEYFLVPAEQATVARAAAREIKVIPVHTFQEALTALEQIGVDTRGSPRIVPSRADTTLASLLTTRGGRSPG